MFTGIIKGIATVTSIEQIDAVIRYAVDFPKELLMHLEKGASVAIDGVCQTVVAIKGTHVWFEAINETLSRTTFDGMENGTRVNIERAAKFGEEIGGHLLSGHIYCTASISDIKENIFSFICPPYCTRFLFTKGYIAVDGISLTLVDINRSRNQFSVHLIPETLKRTTLGQKKQGDRVNLEIDSFTQVAVETITHLYQNSFTPRS